MGILLSPKSVLKSDKKGADVEITTQKSPRMKRDLLRAFIADALPKYKLENVQIGMIASHSALDLADGAKEEGFRTVAVCEKGREKTYQRYKRIINNSIILDNFNELLSENMQKKMRGMFVLFVPNRSLTTYVPIENIETDYFVPMFGNRDMLRTDEREAQYELLKNAGIKIPEQFKRYEEINTPVMVKVQEAKRAAERAFFMCSSPKEFLEKWKSRVAKGILSMKQLETERIWIEEYVIGAQFNFNYFYSPLNDEVEFLGIDRRIQTNIDGILRLTAEEQLGLDLAPQNVEIGHISATIRESMLEKVYEIGEKFVETSKRMYPPGIIGPFSLQGAVTPDLKITIYDLSPRMPGSPVLYSSPYSHYYFGKTVTSGRRVAMEIKEALETDDLRKIIT